VALPSSGLTVIAMAKPMWSCPTSQPGEPPALGGKSGLQNIVYNNSPSEVLLAAAGTSDVYAVVCC
jgi:hypothetical protein